MTQIRRWVMVACVLASIALAVRIDDVMAPWRRERLAAQTFQRGLDLAAAQNYDEAVVAFRQVLALAPRAAGAYESLAEAEVKRGRIDAAIVAYQQLLAIYPYTYVAAFYRQLGLIELRGGRWQEARIHLAHAVALDAADWQAWYLLGHVLDHLGDPPGARAAWRQVIKLHPQFQPVYARLQRSDDRDP